jgi:hypothetical protein
MGFLMFQFLISFIFVIGSRRKQTRPKLMVNSLRVVDAKANAAENNVRKERGKANTTMTIRGKVDAGGFEPPAFWLQTRRSSN